MELTVIGCWGAFPEANEACSGYLLSVEGKNILLDCGSGVLSVLANYLSFEQLDAIVISHYHADHMSDIYSLQYAQKILMKMGKRKQPLYIYGHNHSNVFHTLNYKDSSIAVPIDTSNSNEIYGCSFEFLKTKHQETAYAMKIESKGKKIVYTSDTGWTEGLIHFARDADLLICEASLFNHQKDLNPGHLTAGEAGRLASASNAKKLLLTHFPHVGDIKQLREQAGNEYKDETHIMMAERGKIIQI